MQILVTSIEVNKAALRCGIQPLDQIVQVDGEPAENLCDIFGYCDSLSIKMTERTADVWVTRTPGIPSLSGFQSEQ